MKRLSTISLLLILVLSLFSCEEPVVPVSSIILNSETLTLTEGEEFKLIATVSPSNATDKSVAWSSSDATIASVKDGVVTAVNVGAATITVRSLSSAAKATCFVTVRPRGIAVESIVLSQSEATMIIGDELVLRAMVKPDNATDKTVRWSSSDTNVATVDQGGKITALNVGLSLVSASAGNTSAYCTIIVEKTISYLTFISEGTTTISVDNREGDKTGPFYPTLYYSRDAISWTEWDLEPIVFSRNSPLFICGDNPNGFGGTNTFISTGDHFSIIGNIMSLIDRDDPQYNIEQASCFAFLFSNCTGLTSAPDLPASKLDMSCYHSMFLNCTNLMSAPKLPATTLADFCYMNMFKGCTGLTVAPELPAATMAVQCYSNMFQDCTRLLKAPDLHATLLARSCYSGMFSGCTNLVTAPALPATTLADFCYGPMFSDCTNLEYAPELPATVLTKGCYNNMFRGCIRLTQSPELPATTIADGCYYCMFDGCINLSTAPEVLPAQKMENQCYAFMFRNCESLEKAPYLPGTTMAAECYASMFSGCKSLTEAPVLPSLSLAEDCYGGMFSGCVNLMSAPELPASTLKTRCYSAMFFNCTSLKKAPDLNAETLAEQCYRSMFAGCNNLSYVKCLAKDISANDCTLYWLEYVSYSGDFIKATGMKDWGTGQNGIPEGWMIYDSEKMYTIDIMKREIMRYLDTYEMTYSYIDELHNPMRFSGPIVLYKYIGPRKVFSNTSAPNTFYLEDATSDFFNAEVSPRMTITPTAADSLIVFNSIVDFYKVVADINTNAVPLLKFISINNDGSLSINYIRADKMLYPGIEMKQSDIYFRERGLYYLSVYDNKGFNNIDEDIAEVANYYDAFSNVIDLFLHFIGEGKLDSSLYDMDDEKYSITQLIDY